MSQWRAFACICCLIALGGCGKDGKYVQVSGKVTYNGEPLRNVQVLFQPIADGKGGDTGGRGSFAMTDNEGKFTLEASTDTKTSGAWIGKHQVRIAFPEKALQDENAPKVDPDSDAANPGGIAAPKGKQVQPLQQPVPKEYNSETTLTFEVPAKGTTEANFDLKGPELPKRLK